MQQIVLFRGARGGPRVTQLIALATSWASQTSALFVCLSVQTCVCICCTSFGPKRQLLRKEGGERGKVGADGGRTCADVATASAPRTTLLSSAFSFRQSRFAFQRISVTLARPALLHYTRERASAEQRGRRGGVPSACAARRPPSIIRPWAQGAASAAPSVWRQI